MKSYSRRLVAFFTAAFLAIVIAGCEEKGSAEKVGKEVDDAFKAAKEKIQEATR